MNVWFLSAHDQPRGQSSRTYDYSRELVRRGHHVTMFTNSYCHWTHEERLLPREKSRIEEIDGIRVVWLRTIHYTGNGWRRGMNMLSNVWRSIQVAKGLSDKPDVVIGPSVPIGTGWAASRIAGIKGAAFVFEVRDVWPIALVEEGGLSRWNPVYYAFRVLEKYLYRKSQRISAAMPFLYDHVSESGSDPEKISWIPNGQNFDQYAGLDKYAGGENTPLVAMYVGGFGSAHDVISIVRTASILQHQANDKCRFVIVGAGPKRLECEREASKYKLMNLEFRDPIPKTEIPRLLMGSDILIAAIKDSPIYRFGMNLNKIVDYLASGKPIIFSGRAPNNQIAESGAGFTVPPEDPKRMAEALQRLLEMSPSARIEMGRRGRRYAENEFDIRKLGDRMETLLWQAIKDRKS